MLSTVAELLGVEEKEVVVLACAWMFGENPPTLHAFDPNFIWECYQTTGYIPDFVMNYCSIKEGESHE
jgi:hypothetical protein